jgi:hypothetical protein
MATELIKLGPDGEIVNGFPVYTTRTESEVAIMYVEGIHRSYLEGISQIADREYQLSISPTSQLYQWSNGKYELHPVTSLYPSRNFTNLQNIVQSHVIASTGLNNFTVTGILIDGEPGLGKSMAIHYLASQNSVRRLYRIDLNAMHCLRTTFEKLSTGAYHNIPVTEPTIFLFDEIDKWLDYQISNTYQELVQKMMKMPKSETSESNLSLIPSEEQYSRNFRRDFLPLLLSILERTSQTATCIVIFCSNNFDSIFNDIDMKHFHSLNDRFKRLKFNRCERDEIIGYLRYNNNKLVGTTLHVPNLDSFIDSTPDCQITYRKLNEIAVINAYNPEQIINALRSISFDSSTCFPASSSSAASSSANTSDRSLPILLLNRSTHRPIIPTLDNDHWRTIYKRNCATCSIVFILECDCDICKDPTMQGCHWCRTQEDRWPDHTNLIPFESISEEITKLEPKNPKSIDIDFLNYINQDNIMITYRRQLGEDNDIPRIYYIMSNEPLLRGTCEIRTNIELFDSVIRKSTQPLPEH